ncbi:membrane-spanning 4-domains subfamily A member 4A-like [Puntigrus tetrazona]|uniref:membrane-spanning 4-domains subfamily A member 4A-like n=1 Tax=Puntigrus tetrazona TaxID=1606681 RepID=UPI001C8AFD21|nr:membrane-spanning 4-domains subfamily A member 4A-like [Puntigrus tetrazona]
MQNNEVISTDKATVIIQINPQADGSVIVDGQQARGGALKGFFKAQPKALGTVQIMTGVTVFLLGIVLAVNFRRYYDISVISGITFWGSFIHISAGSLSVAAQNKLNPCVVKASLGMNVIGTITAGISILLMGANIGINNIVCYYKYDCAFVKDYRFGILGILLVFSILQFIISIFISAFACKATCNTDSTVVNVALNRGY